MAFRAKEFSWNPFRQVDFRDLVDGQMSGHLLPGGERRRSLSDDDGAAPPAPIPDRAAMEARWAFREAIRRETSDHRRTVPSGGESPISLARNVAHALYDRELRGSRAVATRRPPGHCDAAAGRKRTGSSGGRGGRDGGDRSPLTVFESPVSTTTSPSLYDRDEAPVKPDEARSAPAVDSFKRSRSESNDVVRSTRERVRKVCYPMSVSREIQSFAEHCSALRYESTFLNHLGGDDELDEDGNRPTSSRAVSTISVSFSPDALTMASTHGDHTVKITCCNSGLLLQSLEGHPRTPWTVKYHPTRSEIVASGCLGHQVRIWDWKKRSCIHMVRLEFAIISLSFHPSGQVLAVANGTRLHFWGVDCSESSQSPASGGGGGATGSIASSERRATALTEMDLRHMLRCVHFPPNGKTLILGGVNPTTDEARRRNRTGTSGMSFYLRLWDFDLDRALNPQSDQPGNGISIARRPVSNPRTFVPRALLYNDGGFDVSPDGLTLCACVELWLPDGVDNAMELIRKKEGLYGADGNEPPNLQLDCDSHADDPAVCSDDITVCASNTKVAVAAAISRLRGIATEAGPGRGARSPSEGLDHPLPRTPTLPRVSNNLLPVATENAGSGPGFDFIPRTPPNPVPFDRPGQLSPPSPPGRRFTGGLGQPREAANPAGPVGPPSEARGLSTPPPPPAPSAAPQAPAAGSVRPPHPLSILSRSGLFPDQKGRYVPHVVTISLDTDPIPEEVDATLYRSGKPYGAIAGGYRPRLGQLMEACPLDPSKASAVTCVKFSPSTDYCLIGYGVREPLMEGGGSFHPVTAIFRIRGGMSHVSTLLSGDDDVNIARFHPDSGHGFVYGTKQGRVRILSPRPWNYYNCNG